MLQARNSTWKQQQSARSVCCGSTCVIRVLLVKLAVVFALWRIACFDFDSVEYNKMLPTCHIHVHVDYNYSYRYM